MGGGRTYNWKDSRKGRGCICSSAARGRRRNREENVIDNKMAAADCAIKQVRHRVVPGDSARTCAPPLRSNNGKPQK
jgi:hypothetical protein